MRRLAVSLLSVHLLLLCLEGMSTQSYGDDGQQRDRAARDPDAVLDALLRGRRNLVSGEFRAVEYTCPPTSVDSPWCRSTIYCAFDRRQPTFRFDRVQNIRHNHVVDAEQSPGGSDIPATDAPPTDTVTMRFVQTADASLHWSSLSSHEVRVTPIEELPPSLHPFDVSSVGLATTGDLAGFPDVHRLTRVFAGQPLTGDVETVAGLNRLTWTFADGTLRRTLWLNPEYDFAPVRMEVEAIPVAGHGDSPTAPFHLRINTSWQQVNDVWVPVSTHHDVHDHLGERTAYRLTLDWISVNHVPDESLFTAAALPDAGFARLVDSRPKGPKVIELLGASTPAAGGRFDDRERLTAQGHWTLLLLGNLLAVAALAVWVALRRRRHTDSDGADR